MSHTTRSKTKKDSSGRGTHGATREKPAQAPAHHQLSTQAHSNDFISVMRRSRP